MAFGNLQSLVRDSTPDDTVAVRCSTEKQLPVKSNLFDLRIQQVRWLQEQLHHAIEDAIIQPFQDGFQLLHLQEENAKLAQKLNDRQMHKDDLNWKSSKRYQEKEHALMLVNGDAFQFSRTSLLADGQECARDLITAVQYASQLPYIHIRIYANLDRLSTAMNFDTTSLLRFVCSFNSYRPYCYITITDAAPAQIQTALFDIVREESKSNAYGKIILGISLVDKEDIATLRALKSQAADHEVLSVLEDVPLLGDAADFMSCFQSTHIKEGLLFCTAYSTRKISPPVKPVSPIQPNALLDFTDETQLKPVQADTWASRVARATPCHTLSSASSSPTKASIQLAQNKPALAPSSTHNLLDSPTHPMPVTVIAQSRKKINSTAIIQRNKKGERIDRMDNTIPYRDVSRIKNMKLCNIYYLISKDQCNGLCNHTHSYKLANSEKPILREVARMTPCRNRTACEDPVCIHGHRCPQSKAGEKDCYFGQKCRFFGWGHGIDTKIVPDQSG